MAGVNGTLFAYGQTGGGKTFTMKAVMEAACAEVFDIIKATPGREYLLRLSAVEIYNEARAPVRPHAAARACATARSLRARCGATLVRDGASIACGTARVRKALARMCPRRAHAAGGVR
jgi:hypothetical protein